MVDTQYKEIIDYLKDAQLDLENAEDSIKAVSYTHLTLPTNREV